MNFNFFRMILEQHCKTGDWREALSRPAVREQVASLLPYPLTSDEYSVIRGVHILINFKLTPTPQENHEF
jgi:hypothetical protein